MIAKVNAKAFVADQDPSLFQQILRALDAFGERLAPRLAWLPDWLEPFAVKVVAAVLFLLAVLAAIKYAWDHFGMLFGWARTFWRRVTGQNSPPDDAPITAKEVRNLQDSLGRIEANLTARTTHAADEGRALPEDALEQAIAAMREVLSSNDPSKADAQQALQQGDVVTAEDALADAYSREYQAYVRVDDEGQLLKAKPAQTAREVAALAATRSVEDAIQWYRKAADLEPEHLWTQIELARLYQLWGDLAKALEAAQVARNAASSDRDRSVALDEVGNVRRAQGDLGQAQASYQASLDIVERLAQADASNAGLQRGLSVSHERIGDVHERLGDTARAIAAYETSLAIAQPLADRLPEHPQFQSDLQITLRRLEELRAKLEENQYGNPT